MTSRLSIALLALHVSAVPVAAQPLWGDLDLPGGAAAARRVFALGNERRTESHFLIDFARKYHGTRPGNSEVARAFGRYVGHVERLDALLDNWPHGLELPPQSMPRTERDRWRDLCELLGLRLRGGRGRPVLELDDSEDAATLASWVAAVGIDRQVVSTELNAGRRVELKVPHTRIPIPLPTAWAQILRGADKGALIAQLTESRTASLLYVALTAMDRDTLAFFAIRIDFLRRLSEDDVAVLAAFGSALRIRDAKVVPPGEASEAFLWQELVDSSPGDPEQFIRNWFRKDDGRVAYFYEAMARLAPPRQAWALGRSNEPKSRLRSVRRVYEHFATVEPDWRIPTRPFYRPVDDPAMVIDVLDVERGIAAPPWWPAILERIVDGSEWPDRPIQRIRDEPADAAWVLNWLYGQPADAKRRFQLFRFAQRQFLGAPRDVAPDVEVSLRGFYRMPALLLALERLGVRTPATVAAIVQSARAVTTRFEPDKAEPHLVRLQAALSLVEQLARHRIISAETLDRLVQQLASSVSSPVPKPTGAIAAWVFDQALPALMRKGDSSADEESALISAMLLGGNRSEEAFTWEGLRYEVDRLRPVIRDVVALRGASRSITLADLAGLHRARRALELTSPTVDHVKAIGARLAALQPSLAGLKPNGRPLLEVRQLERVARTLSRARSPRDASRAARHLPAVIAVIDTVSTHVLPALAYALAVAPTPYPRLYADIASRHTLYGGDTDLQWRDAVWRTSAVETHAGGGLRVRGSLLALDVALAESRMRLLPNTGASATPSVNLPDQVAYIARLVVPQRPRESATGELVLQALDRGRARLATFLARTNRDQEPRDAALREAAMSQARINFLNWRLERGEATVAESLSPTELFYLGSTDPLPSAVGLPAMPFDGCLCLRAPTRRPVEDFSGRAATGMMVVELTDLEIRLLQVLSEIGLPVTLMEDLLPFAVAEALTNVSQFHHDDWEAFRLPAFLTRDRVEEYLLALVAEGVLAPPRS